MRIHGLPTRNKSARDETSTSRVAVERNKNESDSGSEFGNFAGQVAGGVDGRLPEIFTFSSLSYHHHHHHHNIIIILFLKNKNALAFHSNFCHAQEGAATPKV